MDIRTATVSDLSKALLAVSARCWVKALLDTSQNAVEAIHLDVIVGNRPAAWQARQWTYPEVQMVMVSGETRPAALVQALTTGGRQLALGATSFQIGPLQPQCQSTHRTSLAPYEAPRLHWPHIQFDLHSASRSAVQLPQTLVIGQQSPAFPTMANAFDAFFYDNFASTHSRQYPTELARIRIEDLRGRIRRLRVSPTRISISVEGRDIVGSTVQVVGPALQVQRTIGKGGRSTFRSTRTLDQTRVWLIRHGEWLDYREVGTSLAGAHAPDADDVEYDFPVDEATAVATLITQGEGLHLEFKSQIPMSDHEKLSTFKDLVAFANTQGGKLLFGVANDGTVVGIPDADLQETRDQITQMVSAMITPALDYDLESHDLGGHGIVVVTVRPSHGQIFGVHVPPKAPAKFYVRRQGTSLPATEEDLRVIPLRGNQATTRAAMGLDGPW